MLLLLLFMSSLLYSGGGSGFFQAVVRGLKNAAILRRLDNRGFFQAIEMFNSAATSRHLGNGR